MQIDRQDTANKVIALIAEKLSIADKSSITEQTNLEQLGADSLDMVEIIMRLEEQFGIQIDDAKAENIATVKDAIDCVYQLRLKS
jgi:acyl carrier protein